MQISTLEGSVKELKENLSQLQLERTELIAKVGAYLLVPGWCEILCGFQMEAGEGATTAINQLEQEKVPDTFL